MRQGSPTVSEASKARKALAAILAEFHSPAALDLIDTIELRTKIANLIHHLNTENIK